MNITYEVYVSTDSVAVATHSVPYLQRAVFLYLLPRTRWPLGSSVYWSLTAVNLTTGERLDGPMRRFDTFAADAAVDSVVVAVADWGGRSRSSALQLCNSSTLTASVDHNAGMRFGVAQLPTNLKVAGGRLELPVTDGSLGVFPTASAAVHFAQNDWSTCTYAYPGPPFPETNALLAIGALSDRPNCAVFESDGLMAFFEGQARRMPLYGLLLRSASPVIYGTQTVNGVVPRAILYFYPPGTQAAASPAPVR